MFSDDTGSYTRDHTIKSEYQKLQDYQKLLEHLGMLNSPVLDVLSTSSDLICNMPQWVSVDDELPPLGNVVPLLYKLRENDPYTLAIGRLIEICPMIWDTYLAPVYVGDDTVKFWFRLPPPPAK